MAAPCMRPALVPLPSCPCPALTCPSSSCPSRRRVWPLEEMAAAHAYAEKGHVRGKVGITINPAPSPQKPASQAPQE